MSQPGGSFIYNDACNQTITSENRQLVCHSEDRIDRVVYVGERLDEYCAVSGATLYSGRDDTEATLKGRVTQLRSFESPSGQALLAVGLGDRGEV